MRRASQVSRAYPKVSFHSWAAPGKGERQLWTGNPAESGAEHRKPGHASEHRCTLALGSASRSLGGHRPEQSRPLQHPPCPPHGCPLASASSPDAHPTWFGSDPPLHRAATPTLERHPRELDWTAVKTASCPPAPASEWDWTGKAGEGWEQEWGADPAPFFLPIHHRGGQETGHTLVTSPNLGPSALGSEPSSSPTHHPPSQQPLIKQKNKGRGRRRRARVRRAQETRPGWRWWLGPS